MKLKHVKENEKASHGSVAPAPPCCPTTTAAHCAISSTVALAVAVTIKQKANGANATHDAYVLCMHMLELSASGGGVGGGVGGGSGRGRVEEAAVELPNYL